MTLPVATTVTALRATIASWRREGLRVGLVPTMGALHEGHLSLIRHALRKADRCIVTIFVNPTQFAPTEDLDKYPRQLARDLDLAGASGAHLAFAPSVGEMYPDDFATRVKVAGPALGLETDFRPAFFEGVATVVTKLLLQALPDCAVFGEKDYQQLCVIRRLAGDLDIPVEITGAPTVRDAFGLALSSRNAYLSVDQIDVARQLNAILRETATRLAQGADTDEALDIARADLLAAGFRSVDYVAVRDADVLAPWSSKREGRLLAAAWLGQTRLIDNIPVPPA
ncbi:MAG: pantoate--beta-alanine ligase [Rhizobiaceae bacterium]|nr:pantoate--beta-alanine ligase [Rhizobiaceae bacterium]